MNAEELFGELARSQVTLFLDGDRLRYRAPEGALSPDLRVAIAKQRAAIIERLRARRPADNRSAACVVACEPRYWVDGLPKDGRIRTTCGSCGRFVGYRPAEP